MYYFCSMYRIIILLISIVLWPSCKKPYVGNTYVPPSIALSFSESASPPSPDYSNNEHWAALPFRKDMADSVPNASVSDGQATAAVDVFFLHPTLYLESVEMKKYPWNADVNDHEMNEKVDGSSILNQASVFNGSCRVYAPRYRQAHISSFFTSDRKSGEAALEMAYQDTKTAFLYYIKQYNQGRPFIIAGHSQGTQHAGKIIRELIENTELEKQLVAAYVIGMPVPKGYFKSLPVCDNPEKTNCYVTWATYQKGFYPSNYKSSGYDKSMCVNPLSWKTDSTRVSRNENAGGIIWKFNRVIKRINGAQVNNGILWIEKPHVPGRMFIKMNNYHVADYNLFWFNIRENVKQRTSAFAQNQRSILKYMH